MKTLINVKVENSLKREAQNVADDLGFTISSLINAFLRQLVRDRTVEFKAPYVMSKKLEKELGKVETDIKVGRNLSPIFESGEEAVAYLRSQA